MEDQCCVYSLDNVKHLYIIRCIIIVLNAFKMPFIDTKWRTEYK